VLYGFISHFYSEAEKIREKLSSSGQNFRMGKRKMLCVLLFVCLLVFVFKDDLSNILLTCLD
jgi:hypothetical protein